MVFYPHRHTRGGDDPGEVRGSEVLECQSDNRTYYICYIPYTLLLAGTLFFQKRQITVTQ